MESHYISQSGSRTLSKKTVIIAAIALVAVVGAFCVFNVDSAEFRFLRFKGPVEKAWDAWKVQHNKTYGGPEEKARFAVFKKNHKIVTSHNAKTKKNYTLALNKFSDLSSKEFASLYTGASVAFKNKTNGCDAPSAKGFQIPDTLDWRTQGRVGAVKDQQQCGSCWAFSTIGSIEGLSAKKNGQVGNYAEQQLVDCSTTYGNFGCGGGWVQNAFHYVQDKGIAAEGDYPYKAVDQTCQDSKVTAAFKLNDCANVAIQDPQALKEALQFGPVAVYVQADTSDFQFYTSGVVTGTNCFSERQIDHAVLAVGYTKNSWLVKNSWGGSWGDKGYIQLDISNDADKDGVCGILSTPNTYPL